MSEKNTGILSQNKARALEALLDCATFTEAAEKAGITRKTLYSYMRDDVEFARAYKEAQERLTLETLDSIADERRRAKGVILAIMDDEEQPGAVRLRAAQSILDAAKTAQDRAAAIALRNVTANSEIFNLFGRND